MKKIFNLYAIVWFALLVIFNITAFISVNLIWEGKDILSFWIGYAVISIIFWGQFICSYIGFKTESTKKLFYNISLIKVSYLFIITSFIIGLICVLIPFIPYWICLTVCLVVLLINIYAVTKSTVVIDEVERIDEKVITNTLFIKNLIVDAQTLMASAQTDYLKKECKKVYEAIRYSDPISHEELSSIENQINAQFEEFSEAVKSEENDKTTKIANEIIILINNRKEKCKILK